jgi:hypothetical protein
MTHADRGHHGSRPVTAVRDSHTVLDGLDDPAPGLVVPVHPLHCGTVADMLLQPYLPEHIRR